MLCLPLPLLFAFLLIEKQLLASGFLNKKDIGFVGGESGTIYEYMTNVWHWDALSGLLMLLVLVGIIVGPIMIWIGNKKKTQQGGPGCPPQGVGSTDP